MGIPFFNFFYFTWNSTPFFKWRNPLISLNKILATHLIFRIFQKQSFLLRNESYHNIRFTWTTVNGIVTYKTEQIYKLSISIAIISIVEMYISPTSFNHLYLSINYVRVIRSPPTSLYSQLDQMLSNNSPLDHIQYTVVVIWRRMVSFCDNLKRYTAQTLRSSYQHKIR